MDAEQNAEQWATGLWTSRKRLRAAGGGAASPEQRSSLRTLI